MRTRHGLGFDAIGQIYTVLRDPTPDLEQVILRFSGNVIEIRHQGC
jgi:hypothetical protein